MKPSSSLFKQLLTLVCCVVVVGCASNDYQGPDPESRTMQKLNGQESLRSHLRLASRTTQSTTSPFISIDPDDRVAAEIAWDYFENNIQEDTGFANAANRFPSVTMWDLGSWLNGLISAERLGIVDGTRFDSLVRRLLASLVKMELYRGTLPNKVYHTKTLEMVNYGNKPEPDGIGWSVLDLARLSVGLQVLKHHYTGYEYAISQIEQKWSLDALSSGGNLMGADIERFQVDFSDRVQEGRVGYEQYGAEALLRWGMPVALARSTDYKTRFREINGFQIPYDRRSKLRYEALVITTSEPFFLKGIELGFDADTEAMTASVLGAQEVRHQKTGIVTALSEGHVIGKPYFVYNSVLVDGKPWASVTAAGDRVKDKLFASTKAAFGFDALYDSSYTNLLVKHVARAAEPGKGWYAGVFEKDNSVNKALTANTNGAILTAIHYKYFGPLLPKQTAKADRY